MTTCMHVFNISSIIQGGPINPSAMFRHTTDFPNGQSILERGDLDELMAMVRARLRYLISLLQARDED